MEERTVDQQISEDRRIAIYNEIKALTDKYQDSHMFIIAIADEVGGTYGAFGSASHRTVADMGMQILNNVASMLDK